MSACCLLPKDFLLVVIYLSSFCLFSVSSHLAYFASFVVYLHHPCNHTLPCLLGLEICAVFLEYVEHPYTGVHYLRTIRCVPNIPTPVCTTSGQYAMYRT
jgi:hypothetical protein